MLSEILTKKFKLSKHTNIKEWKDSSKCPLSLFTLTSIINQGKEPSIPTFITMAYLLGVTPEEIAEVCKSTGDTIFWRLIAPSLMTDEDKAILDSIKALSPDKKKAVKDLLKTLGV